MEYLKKKHLKELLKQKLAFIISGGVFLLIGVIALIIGFYMSGWSIARWLQTPYAMTALICLLLFVFSSIIIVIEYKRRNL